MERVSQFSFKLFCLTMPKKIKGEPLCTVHQKLSVSEKFVGMSGCGWYHGIAVGIFLSHSAEIFGKESLKVSVISGFETSQG